MNNIAAMLLEERREIVLQTSARTGMSPAIIEKDFWVCWVLDRLFRSSLKDKIIFKGGTSLSKAYHLINRFSEDIDLILDWSDFTALNQGDPAQRLGKSPRKKMLDALDSWGLDCIASVVLPVVQRECGEHCAAHVSDTAPETIVVEYPRSFETEYVKSAILLEIGPKAAWNPHRVVQISPYIAEEYPRLFQSPSFPVTVTTAERAFWEKLTILHAQAQRPSPLPERYARHYYDSIMMARNTELKSSAFAQVKLLYAVASFKHYFYHAGWADYPNAVPGKLHLMPTGHILEGLVRDYAKMKATMLPNDAPALGDILDELQLLEAEVNALQPLPLDIRNYPDMQP